MSLALLLPASETKPLAPEDLWNESSVSEIVPSPDGRYAAYVLSTINRNKNSYLSHIYEVGLTGDSAPRSLTNGDGHDSEPRYSPDGRWLAFISSRESTSRIFLMPRNGGEPFAPFTLDSDMSSITWSPDSTHLCFLAKVPAQKQETDVKVITRYRYRIDGVGYLDEHEEQIFEGDLRTGAVRKLTDSMISVANPTYSPDGARILFTANLTQDHDFNYNTDICSIPTGGGKIERLTDTPESEENPRYSPDGRRIAYLRSRRATDWYAMYDLWSMDAGGRNAVDLTSAFDRNVSFEGYNDERLCAPRWSRDGKSIYILLEIGADTALFQCDSTKSGTPIKLIGCEGQVEYPFFNERTELLLHGRQTAVESTEVYLSTIDGKNLKRLTSHQQEWLKDHWIGAPEKLPIHSADGTSIDGWLLKPPAFNSTGKYPLILTIHGGPIWFYGNAFNFERELWAGQGYVVLYCNPRGSSGYGQAFADAIKADWGNRDYQDMMAAVDAAVATGFIDPKRIAVTGLSYGGIMTNWIIGHTNRFCAAISEEGLCNFTSSFGTDDCQIDWESEFGLPWEKDGLYKKQSPITYAKNVQTPLLIIHGEDDYRTNIQQAEEWFITLKRLGKEVVFLRYPRESHEWRSIGEPHHRFDRTIRILDWWKTYLQFK